MAAESVEKEICYYGAKNTSDQSQTKRFYHNRNNDRAIAKPKRTKRRYFFGTGCNGVVHRVEPTKDGADSHQTRDHNAEPSDQIAYHRGLVRIVVTLPDYAYV